MNTSSHLDVASLVSTIIPVYNRAIFLRDAVKSVLTQSHRPIEIILVDDGSTDNTAQKVSELAIQHPETIRSIRIANSGPGGAREQGRLLARGEFLQYLDSDDELLPCKFEVQVKALNEHPECGVAYGKTRLIDESGNVLKAPFKSSGVAMDQLFPALLVDRWWNTLTPLYRRSVCDKVGPWPQMWMAEDWLYDARIGALGTKLAFVDEFVCDYREHSGDRLTGSGELSERALKNFCQLIPELYQCAIKAGVSVESSEMQHFARWSFSLARQAAAVGDTKDAKNCLDTALRSLSRKERGFDIQAFRVLAAVTGWQFAARFTERLRSLMRRGPGHATLKQSWME